MRHLTLCFFSMWLHLLDGASGSRTGTAGKLNPILLLLLLSTTDRDRDRYRRHRRPINYFYARVVLAREGGRGRE